MAPTIQTNAVADRDRKQRPGEKKSDLVCRVKYCNTLPDIPFDPKFLAYPFPPNRFVEYKPTSLERNYKHDLLTEHDLGVTIDLINPDTYAINPNAILHIDDERLLEEDALTPQDSKRSRHHNKPVPWLKKTEYISNEFNRYGHSNEKTETKVGYNVKKLFKEENMYMDRESQISAINKTFEDAKKPIKAHYSKPNVYAIEEYSVFPDFKYWRYPYAQVMFDNDPASATQMEEMSQALIRGVMDESGEQFVAYFLPAGETLLKRRKDAEEGVEYIDEEVYEYRMTREYNWNVKNKASKGYEENYFFGFREGAVYYNELETRVRLSKRRLKPGAPPNNSKLLVQHRPLDEEEFSTQKLRMAQLEPPQEEEEVEASKDDEAMEQGSEEEDTAQKAASESEAEEEAVKDKDEEEEDEEEADKQSDAAESEQEMEVDEREKEESEEEQEETEKQSVKSSSSAKSSSSSSSSSSESEAEDDVDEQKRKDEAEIFGSDSD